jgi:hypothetical protein
MKGIIDFCTQNYKGRCVFKHNARNATMPITAGHNELLAYAVKQGHDYGFEAVSASGSRYGGTLQDGENRLKQFIAKVGRKPLYDAIYKPDLPKIGALK